MELSSLRNGTRHVATIAWGRDAGDDEGRSHALFVMIGREPLAAFDPTLDAQTAVQRASELCAGNEVLALSQASDGAWLVHAALQDGTLDGRRNGAPLSSDQVPWSYGGTWEVYRRDPSLVALVSASHRLLVHE